MLSVLAKTYYAEKKGISLQVSDSRTGGVTVYAGEPSFKDATILRKVGDMPPQAWTVVRVDLWEVFKRPERIRSLWLGVVGGPAAFDQILLGRTEADLPAGK